MSQPTTIIIFGITGDLSQKKIIPALYDLYRTGRLTETKIVGFSRRPFSDEEIKNFVPSFLPSDFDERFLGLVSYVQGQFDEPESYQKLSEHLLESDRKNFDGCSNKLFYLSVPPVFYEMIFSRLADSGLMIPCGGNDGFSRLLVEKPFGNDLKTAENLDVLLGKLFKESQIFRIDHYLAKDSLFKIVDLHRRDEGIEKRWNSENIAEVKISLFEKGTVGSRGETYDGVGALRDVGQNHVLQMLALTAMDISDLSSPQKIQAARADVLKNLKIFSQDQILSVVRGQYEGYLFEPKVDNNSETETFFRLTAEIETEKFRGVPFVLSAGKGLSKNLTEISVRFKDGMKIVFDVPAEDSMPAYQKILLDCINGDQTIFVSTDEILAEWKFITPIIEGWKNIKPISYKIGADPEMIRKIQ